MPRHNANAHPGHYNHLSFRQLCAKAGIDPLRRIKLVRLMKAEVKYKSKSK